MVAVDPLIWWFTKRNAFPMPKNQEATKISSMTNFKKSILKKITSKPAAVDC